MSDGLGTTDEQPEAPKRDVNGRWLPGVSGNEGRRGYKQDRSRQAIEAAMRDRGEEVARTVVAAALRGDMVAARIILDRLAPDFEMPSRPEFCMGGGALFSTPRNYMAFLQMLLHEGTFNGARVLKPETVALMRQNHIGDLEVVTLKTVRPDLSNDANLFPGMVQKWGLSFDINTQPGPAGRSAGSLAWAGLFNTYFWLDPTKRITGTIMTQLLPFADDQVLQLFAQFESWVYGAITQQPPRRAADAVVCRGAERSTGILHVSTRLDAPVSTRRKHAIKPDQTGAPATRKNIGILQ
jgi:CubicO group peptidase (beta-lactamase class C family)